MNNPVIIGIDEAGRGPLAGPVTAAACYIPDNITVHPKLTDSKKLTESDRNTVYTWIEECCIFGIGSCDSRYIDTHGILTATESAMQQAVEQLKTYITPTYILIDGRDKFWFDYPHSSVIKGDEKELCISAASIIAKVSRDALMRKYDTEFPGYGFVKHKGYGTEEHYKALQKLGQCAIHRRTFIHSTES